MEVEEVHVAASTSDQDLVESEEEQPLLSTKTIASAATTVLSAVMPSYDMLCDDDLFADVAQVEEIYERVKGVLKEEDVVDFDLSSGQDGECPPEVLVCSSGNSPVTTASDQDPVESEEEEEESTGSETAPQTATITLTTANQISQTPSYDILSDPCADVAQVEEITCELRAEGEEGEDVIDLDLVQEEPCPPEVLVCSGGDSVDLCSASTPSTASSSATASGDDTASSPAASTTTATTTSTERVDKSALGPMSMVCSWINCDWPGNYDDLVDHIREIHVELQPYHDHPPHNSNTSSSAKITSKSSRRSTASSGGGGSSHMSSSSSASAGVDGECSASSSSSSVHKKSSVPSVDLHNQRERHPSEQQKFYVCLWEGCKVHGMRSQSRSWLERHVLQHSGDKPFKCIVAGCGERYKSRTALEKHVNAHFNSGSSKFNLVQGSSSQAAHDKGSEHGSDDLPLDGSTTMARAKNSLGSGQGGCGSVSGTPSKLSGSSKRKKVARVVRKRCLIKGCSEDFFDSSAMEQIQLSLYKLNQVTGIDSSGTQSVTFHSTVKAVAKSKNGSVKKLLHWFPEDMLSDEWMSESEEERNKTRTLPLTSLPTSAMIQLVNEHTAFPVASTSSTDHQQHQPPQPRRKKQRQK